VWIFLALSLVTMTFFLPCLSFIYGKYFDIKTISIKNRNQTDTVNAKNSSENGTTDSSVPSQVQLKAQNAIESQLLYIKTIQTIPANQTAKDSQKDSAESSSVLQPTENKQAPLIIQDDIQVTIAVVKIEKLVNKTGAVSHNTSTKYTESALNLIGEDLTHLPGCVESAPKTRQTFENNSPPIDADVDTTSNNGPASPRSPTNFIRSAMFIFSHLTNHGKN